MLRVGNGRDQLGRFGNRVRLVPTPLVPVFDDAQVVSQDVIRGGGRVQSAFQISVANQVQDAVGVAVADKLLSGQSCSLNLLQITAFNAHSTAHPAK